MKGPGGGGEENRGEGTAGARTGGAEKGGLAQSRPLALRRIRAEIESGREEQKLCKVQQQQEEGTGALSWVGGRSCRRV